jgi:hypothetical protein
MPIRIMADKSRIYLDVADQIDVKPATGSSQMSILLGDGVIVFLTSSQARILRDKLHGIVGGSDGQ